MKDNINGFLWIKTIDFPNLYAMSSFKLIIYAQSHINRWCCSEIHKKLNHMSARVKKVIENVKKVKHPNEKKFIN